MPQGPAGEESDRFNRHPFADPNLDVDISRPPLDGAEPDSQGVYAYVSDRRGKSADRLPTQLL